MSLTVNDKPSGFRPVGGGELLYTFTESSLSGKTNYRVNIWLNGLSSIVPIHEFRPDANLDIEADIAPLLRGVLALTADPDDRFVETYVEYQAVWDEGSDSAVALSGDVIYAFVGVNHRLNRRTTYDVANSRFLIPTAKLFAWDGRTAYIEFLATAFAASTWGVYYCPYSGAAPTLLGTLANTTGIQQFTSNSLDKDGKIQVRKLDSVLAFISGVPVDAPTTTALTNNLWNGVACGDGIAVIVGESAGTDGIMVFDGTNLTVKVSPSITTWTGIVYAEDLGLFVAVARGGVDRIMTSPDGTTWTARTAPNTNQYSAITYGNGRLVAVAQVGTSGQRVMYSDDGITWVAASTPIPAASPTNQYWTGVAYGNGKFVAVGEKGIVMTSRDGETWTDRSSDNTEDLNGIAFGNGVFVAVGQDYSMMSADGVNWDIVAMPAAAGIWTAITFDEAYGFVAVSSGMDGIVAISFGGDYWYTDTIANTASWSGIASGGGYMVAVANSGTDRVNTMVGLQVYDIEVEILEECNNPVYLKWVNDNGGLSTWLFSYNQIFELAPSILSRDNNLLLVADGLTFDQWKMLQELNKDGIEYGDNQKTGVFCQDFTDESNPETVFPIPLARQTQTKKLTHQFELTIRYPQIPNIQL